MITITVTQSNYLIALAQIGMAWEIGKRGIVDISFNGNILEFASEVSVISTTGRI
jgi:hypothetical protein